MKKNIIVTGGCGFIGSHIVDKMINDGCNVIVLDNMSTGLEENKNSKAKYIDYDIENIIDQPNEFIQILNSNNIKEVYHLAAMADVRVSIIDPIKCYRINQLASVALADSCINAGVEKLVFTSTSAIYGQPIKLPVDENHQKIPISPYGLSKLAFERYLFYKSLDNKIEIAIFRLPNVYGPRQRPDLEAGVVAIFYEKIKNNDPIDIFGDGKQTRDWVHVNDISDAFIKISNKKLNKILIVNLGSSISYTLLELYDYISKKYNYTKIPNYRDSVKGDIKHMSLSRELADTALDWSARITLEEGIKSLSS